MVAGRSLRVRLLVAAAISLAVALALAGIALTLLFEQHVERRLEAELETHLDQLTAALTLTETGAPEVTGPLSDPRFVRPYGGLYWQIEGPAGGAIRSRSLWDFSLELPADPRAPSELHRYRLTGPAGRVLLALERQLRIGERAFRLVVAVDRREIRRVVLEFGQSMALSLGVLALFLLAAAAAQVSVGLRPLARLRAELARMRAGHVADLGAGFPSEVQPLVEDLSTLLREQAAAMERARTQADDLAHGLKTPLTILAAEGRRLTERGETAAAELIGQQIATMRRHIDHQLARARAAGASRVAGPGLPIAPPIARLVRVMNRLHDHGTLELTTQVDQGHRFAGEAQDLEEMIGNLLDNACKWAKRRVRLESRHSDGRIVVLVDDDGPGLPAEQRDAVFERGRRLDQSVPGSGLGLAIVRDLAEIYGGSIVLEDSPEGGLRARLELPTPAPTL